MVDQLHAYLHEKHIGTIRRTTSSRTIRFDVASDYDGDSSGLSEGVALTPGRQLDVQPISNFLGGYLPEGRHREHLASKRGLDSNDLFGLLQSYGLTMAGALSVRTDDSSDDTTPSYRHLTKSALREKAQKAVRDFDLGNEPDSGRSTLPGFQPKLLLATFEGEWFQPLRRAHSTHIVKPELERRPSAIHDEFYSHELSRHMGLSSFASEIIRSKGMTLLAIERFDRKVRGKHNVEMIHQEDAAQVLGLDWVSSTAKFQDPLSPSRQDRPTAARLAEIFGSVGTGGDVGRWLRYLIFSILVGNHDGHAKNVSLIHEGGDSRIADLYDAVPILHINDDPARIGSAKINDELALALNGVFAHHKIARADITAEAASWGALSNRQIATIIDDTFESFAHALDDVTAPDLISAQLVPRLRHNVDRLSSGKKIGKPKV